VPRHELASRLAVEPAGHAVCLADIVTRQQLSRSYLEQLFCKLRRAGLVRSSRGPGGGYQLARPAEAIAIAHIVSAVDEPIRATRCDPGAGGCLAGPVAGGPGTLCQTHDLWFELGRQIELFLSGITLADVVDGRVAGRAACLDAAGLAAARRTR
jgi:Rrf2 family iron-sulfur cluster assembly transcriptional regulator